MTHASMNSKLTLNVDKDLAQKAKLYARSRGRSLSDLVENYFKILTSKEQMENEDYPPIVKSLLGAIRAPENLDYKSDLSEQLTKKYLNE